MKTHVEHSIAIIRHLPSLDYLIPAVMEGHHETLGQTGAIRRELRARFPIGAKMPGQSRDAFDAITSVTRKMKTMDGKPCSSSCFLCIY